MSYNPAVALDETVERSYRGRNREDEAGPPEPGLVQLFAGDRASFTVFATAGPLTIGRGADCTVALPDTRASRRHVELAFAGGRWTITDLGSRNGTYVDGARIAGAVTVRDEVLLVVGSTLFIVTPDLRGVRSGAVEVRPGGIVVGPRLAAEWRAIDRLAELSRVLHLHGETGTGKELAARRFHGQSPRAGGPFIAVNCAAVPQSLAERLFFGARRGAYSGADVDSEGYLAAADGGTLFLDEIGDLPAEVQPKLLRALELGEVLPLGAARPRRIDIAVCSATHVDLRRRVAGGRFREDLYFRVGQPMVCLSPLRTRREEIPWLIEGTLERIGGIVADVSLVETALLRPWPGNARELCNAVAAAAHLVKAGTDDGVVVKGRHLDPHVGRVLEATPPVAVTTATATPPITSLPAHDEANLICGVLARERGNVTRAAEVLGLHRTQLRRWLAQHQIDPRHYRRGLPDDAAG
ncbi:MAG: sensory box protein/sigma-54 dependent DNA-binding response regulator [Myxococcales bacterium]|nr:sensory box protein/sigma-54 dependent DNA-binding response regulator [Myxococcales bacterium]